MCAFALAIGGRVHAQGAPIVPPQEVSATVLQSWAAAEWRHLGHRPLRTVKKRQPKRRPGRTRPAVSRPPSREARASFAFWSTVYGTAAGAAASSVMSIDDPRADVLLAMAGGVLGGAGALWASRPEHGGSVISTTVASGVAWGSLHGALYWHDGQEQEFANWAPRMLLGGLAGAGAGGLSAWLWQPREGTVAMANSGALWGLMGTSLWAWAQEAGGDATTALTLLGTGGGMALGALVGSRNNLSRSDALLLDLCTTAGLTLAVIFAVGLADNSGDSRQISAVLTTLGMGVGFSIGGLAISRSSRGP